MMFERWPAEPSTGHEANRPFEYIGPDKPHHANTQRSLRRRLKASGRTGKRQAALTVADPTRNTVERPHPLALAPQIVIPKNLCRTDAPKSAPPQMRGGGWVLTSAGAVVPLAQPHGEGGGVAVVVRATAGGVGTALTVHRMRARHSQQIQVHVNRPFGRERGGGEHAVVRRVGTYTYHTPTAAVREAAQVVGSGATHHCTCTVGCSCF
jgi:hypothetical protein